MTPNTVKALPWQEEGNAEELTKHGVALRVNRAREVPAIVGMLLRNPRMLAIMRECALRMGRPNASCESADLVLSAIRRQPGG